MHAVTVDPRAQTAQAEAGARWHHVVEKSTPYGLAPVLGTSPHVGVVGYTLGGGLSWLGRRYGFASDSVRSIELVTADGQLRRASPTEHPDLFWGLRGGGGNFGIVTAIEFALYPVARVYGGHLTYPGELVHEALRFFRAWSAQLPEQITSSITIFKFPDLPQLPPELRGRIQVELHACVTEPSMGPALIQPWLDWHTPQKNAMRELPFSQIGEISNDPVDPRAAYFSSAMFDTLSDAALDTLEQYAVAEQSPLFFTELRHLGGAISRGDPTSSAIGNREAQYYLRLAAPSPTEAARNRVQGYIGQLLEQLRPERRSSVYLNFMLGSEAQQRVQDGFPPEHFERLLELKETYDPDNLFRYSYQLVRETTVH